MDQKELGAELHSIRRLMERSAKFISLSGLSGVLAGVYALAGAGAAYGLTYKTISLFPYEDNFPSDNTLVWQLAGIGLTVLVAAIVTAVLLSSRKARIQGQQVWNPASKALLRAIAYPLVAGGLLVFIAMAHGWFALVAPVCLIFYGLALVAGSRYTYRMVEWLGIMQLALGLVAAAVPGYGLLFWSLGFGVLHIVYGIIMHVKYDRRGEA